MFTGFFTQPVCAKCDIANFHKYITVQIQNFNVSESYYIINLDEFDLRL